MSEKRLYVHGLGHFHPANVIDNRFLESLDIGTNEEWILDRVGIRTRRTVLPLDYIRETRNSEPRAAQEAAVVSNAESGKFAGRNALERAGLEPNDIGMVIAGGCSPDLAIPAEACTIAAELDIDAPALDMSSACSSFAAQLHLLSQMVELPRFVLVVNPENTTRVVDYNDRSTAVLWGDGTAAAVVSREEVSRLRVTASTLASSPARWKAVLIPRQGHFAQDGSAVQRFAVKTTTNCLAELLPGANARVARTGGRVIFIGHQANLVMLQSVCRRVGLPDSAHWYNVSDYGNTGAAGAPTVLSQGWDDLRSGDTIVLVVVGSGLTWSSLRIDVE